MIKISNNQLGTFGAHFQLYTDLLVRNASEKAPTALEREGESALRMKMHFLKRPLIKGRLTFLEFETSGDSLMPKLRMPQKLFCRKGMSRKLRQKPESGFCIWVEINNFANLLKASKPTKPLSLTFSGLFHLQQPPTTGHHTHEVLKVSIFLNQIRVSLLVFLPLNRRCLEMMVEN